MTTARSEKLKVARRQGDLIRFSRPYEPGDMCGYVLDVGPQFFLLRLVSDSIRFDGFVCCRIADIRDLQVAPTRAFIETALRIRCPEPQPRPAIDLGSTEALVRTAAAQSSLVTLHCERTTPDVCWIGQMMDVRRGVVWLRRIDPNAVWEAEPDPYALRTITRLDFGGDYEAALHLVGGEPS